MMTDLELAADDLDREAAEALLDWLHTRLGTLSASTLFQVKGTEVWHCSFSTLTGDVHVGLAETALMAVYGAALNLLLGVSA